jgi:hypothetical protein
MTRKSEFRVSLHIFPDLLQDEEKFTNYFRMSFESFKKLTRFVRESVSKNNTNYRTDIGGEY